MSLFLLLLTALAQQSPLMEDNDRDPRVFIANKDGTTLYDSPRLGTSVASVDLGELFFAVAETAEFVRLARFDSHKQAPRETLGWARKIDVVEGARPLTVGRAIESGLLNAPAVGDASEAFSLDNELYLRVVTKPDMNIAPARRPGGPPAGREVKFTWFYVYDISGGSYLLGSRANLLTSKVYNTRATTPGKLLLGWELERKLQLWPTNIVLEYNTDPQALGERKKKRKPATMYSSAALSEASAKESLNYYDNPDFEVGPDPIGLPSNLPRLHVTQKLGDDVYQVASLGSIKGIPLESSPTSPHDCNGPATNSPALTSHS